jgi:DMSO/TMAO reductase YedYZ molybdopterin-dependent catalytic subunit
MSTWRTADRRTTALAALAGLVAGGFALAVAELIAAVVSPPSAPLLAVGSAFIDVTPPWLKDFAIATFGTNDKLALLIGMAGVVAVLAALAGVVGLRHRHAGTALVLALGVVAGAAAVTRAAAGQLDVLPSVLGTGAGSLVLGFLLDRLRTGERSGTSDLASSGSARRSFLVAAAVTSTAAVTGWGAGHFVGRRSRDVAATRSTLDLPPPASAAPQPSSGTTLQVDGITPWQTPNADFYRIDTALTVPRVAPEDWSLRIHGDVEQEVVVTFDDLLAGDLVERWITLTCVSNEVGGDLAGNARWLGHPLRRLLARASPRDGADMVLSTSADGFSASTPLDVLTRDDEALLAIGMNGEPLPLEHGFPVRMVVPGLYGYVSATKWVVDLEVTRFSERTAYWTDRGWAERGPIKTASRIDVPGPFARLTAGPVAVAGVAWAQTRGIERVEVQVDDGPWAQASLAQALDDGSWLQWVHEWDAPRGNHTLRVRATDGTGELQTQEDAPPMPDGSSGWHSVVVQVS